MNPEQLEDYFALHKQLGDATGELRKKIAREMAREAGGLVLEYLRHEALDWAYRSMLAAIAPTRSAVEREISAAEMRMALRLAEEPKRLIGEAL